MCYLCNISVKEVRQISLEEFFGNSVLVKVVDFFLENRFWDYTKSDIAKHTDKSRQSIYNVWPALEKYNIVTESRRIGGTTLYKTNLDSPIVKAFSKLSLSIASTDVLM